MKNLKIITPCLLIFFILSCENVSAAGKSGLLIGLKSDIPGVKRLPADGYGNKPFYEQFRTLWIYSDKEGIKLLSARKLIVPREDDFWQVGILTVEKDNWLEDQLYAVPWNKKPVASPVLNKEKSSGFYCLSIISAGRDFIGVEGYSEGFTQGAAHPWNFSFLEIRSMDNPEDGMDIEEILGPGSKDKLDEGARDYLEANPGKRESLADKPADIGWSLIRNRGRWAVIGFLTYSSEVFRGAKGIFEVSLTPSERLVSNHSLSPPWEVIKQSIPDAEDAFSTPSGSMVAVVTKERIMAYISDPEFSLNTPSGIFLLEKNEKPVMIQWVEGSDVDQWTSRLRRIFEQ